MTTPPHPDVGRIATDPDAFEDFYREHLATVQRLVAGASPTPTSPPT
jgi:RNA polymerase sigma-70 factor (ECF subfamily)